MMAKQMTLPDVVWLKLLLSWVGFFTVMGVLNLYVAFNFPTDTWVNFKLFGGMGLMLVFAILQALMLAKHVDDGPAK
jgi:intracellular septation protein